MPEPGGATTHSGIQYQDSICALYFGRLCDARRWSVTDRVTSVWPEATEPIDDIVIEFADGHRTYLQAKEDITASSKEWRELWSKCREQYQKRSFQQGMDKIVIAIGTRYSRHHTLQGLCERAAYSETYDAWRSRITIEHWRLLEKIRPHLGIITEADLHRLFHHMEVRILPGADIERETFINWMPESTTAPANLFAVLRDYASTMGRERKRITAPLLSAFLSERHDINVHAQPETDTLRTVVRSCSGLLRQQTNTITGTDLHIERSVVHDVVTWTTTGGDEERVALLLDQAGVGKTVIMRDVLVALEERDVTVLGIKADQQLSGIAERDELHTRLGFPIPIDEAIATLAAVGIVVVLVDQVDALSLSLAHDQRALTLVLDLVARLRRNPNVRIVLSCRSFDRDNDPQLRRLDVKRTFPLSELSDDEAAVVVTAMGIQFAHLHPTTQRMLRIPLHLDLFGRIVARHQLVTSPPLHARDLELTSLQDLYALLWRDIICTPDDNAPPVSERVAVLHSITAQMHHHQRVSVPQTLFTLPDAAPLHRALNWLQSMNIIVQGLTEFTFFHQTFFDYCYAREFAERGGQLTSEILRSDQGLFARPQLVQVIAYLRGTNFPAYLREIHALLAATNLRFHLRMHLLRWLGALPTPTDDEWRVMRRLLYQATTRPLVLGAMAGNASWFARIQGQTMSDLLLLEPQEMEAETLLYLRSVVEIAQREVAALLHPYLGMSEQWNRRIDWVLWGIKTWRDPEIVGLYESLLRVTPLHRDMLHDIEQIAKLHPDAACRIILNGLTHELDAYTLKRDNAPPEEYISSFNSHLEVFNGSQTVDAFGVLSATVPAVFVTTLLPWLERVLSLHAPTTRDWPIYIGDDLSSGWHERTYAVQHMLLQSFVTSLVGLAESDYELFRVIVARLTALPYQTPQLLLAEAYRRLPRNYAAEALAFLIADSRRLKLGARDCYDARRLIEAIRPHLSFAARQSLEDLILAETRVYPCYGRPGLRWRGRDCLYLLQSLPRIELSPHGLRVFQELERKFPNVTASNDPTTIQGGFVGSPIPSEALARMSDSAWIRAMSAYHGAARNLLDPLRGGPSQLGQMLLELVKSNPDRFAALALKTPVDCDPSYVDAFVRGLAESTASSNQVFATVRHFSAHHDGFAKRQIMWALQKRLHSGLPDDLRLLLEEYLFDTTNDPHDDLVDPHSGYIHSVRGDAFETLMRDLDWQGTDTAKRHMWELIEFLARDPLTMLRVGAIEQLLYRLHEDRDRAVALFNRIMKGHPKLLQSHFAQEFLYYGSLSHVAEMLPYMRQLLTFDHEQSQQRGAELVCLAAFSPTIPRDDTTHVTLEALATDLLTGRVTWRRGAARVYARNQMLEQLLPFFHDEDSSVRTASSAFLSELRYEHADQVTTSVRAFAGSLSLYTAMHAFTEYLWKYSIGDTEWTLVVLEDIVQNPHSPGRHFYDGSELVKLTLRIYTESIDETIRARVMNLFDALTQRFPNAAGTILDEWDRS